MKKIILIALLTLFVSTLTFADYYNDIMKLKGKKIEIVLNNYERSEIGILKDSSKMGSGIVALILVSENGQTVIINLSSVAIIKEVTK